MERGDGMGSGFPPVSPPMHLQKSRKKNAFATDDVGARSTATVTIPRRGRKPTDEEVARPPAPGDCSLPCIPAVAFSISCGRRQEF